MLNGFINAHRPSVILYIIGVSLLPLTFLRVVGNYSVGDLFLTLSFLTLILIIAPLSPDPPRFLLANQYAIPFLIFSGGVFISLSVAHFPAEAILAYLQMFFIFIICYSLSLYVVRDNRYVRYVLIGLAIMTSVLIIFMSVFTFLKIDLSYGLFLLQTGWRGRVSFGGQEPNIPGRIVLQAIPLFLFFAFSTRSFIIRMLNFIIAILGIIIVILTASRSSMLAGAIGGMLYLFFFMRMNQGFRLRTVILALSLTIIFITSMITIIKVYDIDYQRSLDRLSTVFDVQKSQSSLQRIHLMDQAIQSISNNPLLGKGLDNFHYHTIEGINVHNPIIAAWAENGFFGFLGMLGIYLITALAIFDSWYQRFFNEKLLMVLAIVSSIMIFGDMFMANSYKRILWMPVIIFMTYYSELKYQTSKSQTRLSLPEPAE